MPTALNLKQVTNSTERNADLEQASVAPPGSPWPAPQKWKTSERRWILDPLAFRMTSNAVGACDVIAESLSRYRQLVFGTAVSSGTGKALSTASSNESLSGLRVVVTSFEGPYCRYPKHKEDESYTLNVPVGGEALLVSTTVWGALRGKNVSEKA